jgi:hypothetical protein
VVIDIFIRPPAQRTVLVGDGNDKGVDILKGIPAFTSRTGRFIRWIARGMLGYKKFVYMAMISKSSPMGQVSTFTGTVTLKTEKATSVAVEGNSIITAQPFCWADLNSDRMIDDEEILDAYDLLSGLKGAEPILKEVEALWSAGRYRWDQKTHSFQSVNDDPGQRAGH